MQVFLPLVLASLLAVGQCASLNANALGERSFIDPIIKAILESFRPKFANLTFEDVKETIQDPNLNVSISVVDIKIQGVDKFVIRDLKSNIFPSLKLANLTLTWERLVASAFYDVNGTVNVAKKPIQFKGKGGASASVFDLFFTIGAHMELKNQVIQVKPKGLFGFDVRVGSVNVTLGSLLGSEDLGKILGTFLSEVIPGFIDDVKNPLFNALHDDLVKLINEVLKNNGTKNLLGGYDDSGFGSSGSFGGLLPVMDLSDELASFESDESPFDLKL